MNTAEILFFPDLSDMDASPALENGYTAFANDLLEVIMAYPFSKNQLLVLMCVARQTYGWHRAEHYLTTTFIAEAIQVDRANVSRAIQELHRLNVLKVKQETGQRKVGMLIGINSHFNTWINPKASAVKETAEKDLRSKQQQKPCQNNTQIKKIKQSKKDKSTDARGSKKDWDEAFDRFYAAYPKKKNRATAVKAWEKKVVSTGDLTFVDRILEAIAEQKKSEDWLKEGGRFIPLPASWLNAGAWANVEKVEIQEDWTEKQLTIINLYNRLLGNQADRFLEIVMWTPERAVKIDKMLGWKPLDWWEGYYRHISGKCDWSWMNTLPDFDFFHDRDTIKRVVEGKHDRRS